MRDLIQRHNRLNGVTFCIVEFGLIALFIGGFATCYVLQHRALMAVVASGIALNCVPVVVFGLQQLAQDRANGRSIGSFWDPQSREKHRSENPNMLRDTLTLTLGTLLPFVTLLAVLFDIFKQPKS